MHVRDESRLSGELALVTGATGDIGRAITESVARLGMDVITCGRDPGELVPLVTSISRAGGSASAQTCDLRDSASIAALVSSIGSRGVRLLVHCAAEYVQASVADTALNALRAVMETNFTGPFHLTQSLLPALKRSRGDVVFVNSSAALQPGANLSAYAASKAALRAFAESLRAEINADGVRVLTVFPGRTASDLQRRIHLLERKPYRPQELLQPEDVAQAIVTAVQLPATAELTELRIRSRAKPS